MTLAEALQITLGDRISKARRYAGIEQGELAAKLGISRPLVSKWEGDKAEPKVSQLAAISKITGVPVAWFVTGELSDTTEYLISASAQDSLLDSCAAA